MENNFDTLMTVPQSVFSRLVAAGPDNNNLLGYSIHTTPAPLQASPSAGGMTTAALTIVAAAGPGQDVYCNEIRLMFDIGELAQNFTSVGTGILVAVSPSDQWQIAQIDEGIFSATPKKPMYNKLSTAGIVIQIYNVKVNRQVGTFALTIQETSSTDGTHFTKHTDVYNIAKFPYGFFVSDFTASTPEVNDGTPVLLTWHGSADAAYAILYGSEVVDVTRLRRWMSPPLHNDTTFILRVTPVDTGDGTPVTTYLQTTVNVHNPDLAAAALLVKQTLTVGSNPEQSAVSVYGTQTNDSGITVGGPQQQPIIWFEGATGVTGGTTSQALQVGGTVLGQKLSGATKVSGTATIQSDVLGNGNSTIDTLVVDGNLTVNGILSGRRAGLVSAGAQLSGGRAVVALTPAQQAAVGQSYSVLLSPAGPCNGLHVTEKNATGFTVAEAGGGNSNVAFDWLIAPA